MMNSTSSLEGGLIQPNKRAFSGWPMIIGWVGMMIFAIHASTHMVGAGDTWVAMACGRHFINHGVNTVEPFSANSHKPGPTPEEVKTWPGWAQWITDKVGLNTVKYWHPTGWVNQNWLTHVIFYWLTTLSPVADAKELSFNTLVYWKFALYILSVICIYYTGRLLGVNPALSAAFACAALFIGRSYLDVRPAGFSNLLVAVFMLVLVLATYRNCLYIWLIVPLTIFWANIHGGYIYVFITLVPIVVLRLLTTLSKRTTVSVFSILTWLALYAAMYKYTSHEPFTPVSPTEDKLLVMVVLLILGSIGLLAWRSVNPAAFYGYHIATWLFIFLVLFFARLFLVRERAAFLPEDMIQYVGDSRVSFITAFAAAAGLGVILTLLKDRLTVTTHRAVWHTAGAGVLAFVASIVFNPFHLTNLTHTFVVSISEYAEGWRNVHEWWPAFRWDCPVGTSFPFMIMLIAGAGMLALWLGSRLLVPKLLKGPRAELESQQRFFNVATQVLGFFAAMISCWALMVSFSLIDVTPSAFLLVGLFVGILWASVFVNVHFIYLVIFLSFFALATGDKSQGYAGRYIFPFVTLPCYFVLHIVGGQLSSRPRFLMRNMVFVVIAAVAALMISLVIENPFKFEGQEWVGRATPATTFVRLFSIIAHPQKLWGLHRTWSPQYEANLTELPGFYENLFPALYILNGVCIVSWLLAPAVKGLFVCGQAPLERSDFTQGAAPEQAEPAYQMPRIDLALITVAAMTVYMAYRSRRFTPIAGSMSCPIIAMFVQQTLERVSSAWNFHRRGRLKAGEVPVWLQRLLTVFAAVVVGGIGTFWGWKFKKIYLDPSPNEPRLSSMFMRMTASAVKPFDACRFIVANHLSGNMFNYWTEGGFIAWAQPPDPSTGRTPLRLFIDGRAQAAYNYQSYIRWSEIMSGGEIVMRAKLRKQELTPEDLVRIGEWVDSQLRPYNVWVILMPLNQFDMPFVRGIEYNPNWRLVYMDDKQKVYVDITTRKGQQIFTGIEDGRTKYPDERTRNIMIAHNALMFSRDPAVLTRGLDCIIKSFEKEPTRTAMQIIQYFYEQAPPLRPQITEFWKRTFEDFMANEKRYLNSDGYHQRILGALMAMDYLRPAAAKANDKKLLKVYEDERAKLTKIMQDFRYYGGW